MKENKDDQENNSLSIKDESKPENDNKNINSNPISHKERKKPDFNIPIVQINITYFQKKSNKKIKIRKKKSL